jgi:hypothetical protein
MHTPVHEGQIWMRNSELEFLLETITRLKQPPAGNREAESGNTFARSRSGPRQHPRYPMLGLYVRL